MEQPAPGSGVSPEMRRLALILLVCACGDARHPLPGLGAPDARLRVMSYNLNFGLRGDPSNLRAIADSDADLVLLQETTSEWAAAIGEDLDDAYPHRRFTPTEDWPAGGMGVISKSPLVSVTVVPNPVGPFFAHRIVVDSALGRIQVLDVHLRPPMSDEGSWVVGFFSTREVRKREIEHLIVGLDPALPTLIVGDFNEEGDGLALQHLASLGYADAVATYAGTAPTWSWKVGTMTLRFQLDHLLHDRRLAPITARVVEAGRSDHKPVWADFARR